jgi:hypothetical protein
MIEAKKAAKTWRHGRTPPLSPLDDWLADIAFIAGYEAGGAYQDARIKELEDIVLTANDYWDSESDFDLGSLLQVEAGKIEKRRGESSRQVKATE